MLNFKFMLACLPARPPVCLPASLPACPPACLPARLPASLYIGTSFYTSKV